MQEKSLNKRIFNVLLIILFLFQSTVFAATPLEEAKYYIKNYYVDYISDNKLNVDNVNDLIKNLNDPYSAYFSRDEFNNFINAINQSYVGVGVTVDKHDEGILITGVFENSSADKAGINTGDIIVEVNGTSLTNKSVEEGIALIKGEENTYVDLKIKRNISILNFHLKRTKIEIATVTGEFIDGHIGYIKITSFGENTNDEFLNVYNNLKSKGADIFILDIRDNGGGFLYTSIEVLSQFIGESKAVILKDKNNNEEPIYGYRPSRIINDRFILLINNNSASASEITAVALKDYNKAILIGTTTYGKGTAQSFFELSNGDVLKLTVQKFYSPKGKAINKIGVSPDVYVKDDSKKVALLLAERQPVNNNNNYVKFIINGKTYYSKLSSDKNLNYIIKQIKNCEFYIGVGKNWIKRDVSYYSKLSNPYIGIKQEMMSLSIYNKFNEKLSGAQKKYGYVNVPNLNLRSGPSTNYSVLTRLSKNIRVEILDVSNEWVKVKVYDKIGYVYYKYISLK